LPLVTKAKAWESRNRWHRDRMTELRRVRQEAGLSQLQAASLLAVPVNTFRMWDSGLRPTPRPVVERVTTLPAQRAHESELLGA
jgi:DNA-binding transcriptional regulator YiaG